MAVVVVALMTLFCVAHLQEWFKFASPRGTLLISSAIVLFEMLSAVPGWLKNARAGRHRPLPRGSRVFLQNLLIWNLDKVAIVGGLLYFHGWTPRDVGLSPVSWPALWFLAGFALYLPLILSFQRIRFHGGLGRRELQAWFRAMHAFLPRERRGRTMVWAISLANPFTEEFLHRGVFVYMASSLGTPVPLAVLCGAVLCASVHLYQGPKALYWHLTFYAGAVGLLFSPGGLWAAFGLHLAGDVFPGLSVPRAFRELRAKRCRAPRAPELKAAA